MNKIFYCELCDYKCSKKYNFEKHKTTGKHLSMWKSSQKELKVAEKVAIKEYFCYLCSYNTEKIYNYKKHLSSKKHMDKESKKTINKCKCGKYIENSEMYNHHNISCALNDYNDYKNNSIIEKNNERNPYDIMNVMMKELKNMMIENKEFKSMLIEQNKIITEIVNTPNTINNHIHNKQFNLNVFLNETCKDAMNLSDFIENIKVSMEDMEKTGELGFAKGMSRIIMNNLNAIDVCRRPIHCSDIKRETLYIKNNGIWEKESDDKKNTKEIIYKISCLNEKQLNKWREMSENRGYDNIEHSKNDEFMKLVMEINKLQDEEIDKVITSISKHVVINKINNSNRYLM